MLRLGWQVKESNAVNKALDAPNTGIFLNCVLCGVCLSLHAWGWTGGWMSGFVPLGVRCVSKCGWLGEWLDVYVGG